jgi:hypothetical protein
MITWQTHGITTFKREIASFLLILFLSSCVSYFQSENHTSKKLNVVSTFQAAPALPTALQLRPSFSGAVFTCTVDEHRVKKTNLVLLSEWRELKSKVIPFIRISRKIIFGSHHNTLSYSLSCIWQL